MMRLHIKLSNNTELVPFNYQHTLVQTFHKWLGRNEIHDAVSLYSLSWLQGGQMQGNGFTFPHGGRMFVSSYDDAVIHRLIDGINICPSAFFGMGVKDGEVEETPRFSEYRRFLLSSPVLIRKRRDSDNRIEHIRYDDAEADTLLTQTLQTKLNKAGLHCSAEVRFDRSYRNPKTKLVTIGGIQNRASFCPVIVEGDAEAAAFAWDVGIGHSTGCGFGSLA